MLACLVCSSRLEFYLLLVLISGILIVTTYTVTNRSKTVRNPIIIMYCIATQDNQQMDAR